MATFFLFYFLKALESDINSNRLIEFMFFGISKYVLGRSQVFILLKHDEINYIAY